MYTYCRGPIENISQYPEVKFKFKKVSGSSRKKRSICKPVSTVYQYKNISPTSSITESVGTGLKTELALPPVPILHSDLSLASYPKNLNYP